MGDEVKGLDEMQVVMRKRRRIQAVCSDQDSMMCCEGTSLMGGKKWMMIVWYP